MGATTAWRAPQEGPRPFLSVLPTAPSSCACTKGKLQLSKTNPKGGTSLAALGDCWPRPFRGAPGLTARGWEGTTSPPCLLPGGGGGGGLAGCPAPCPGGWEAKPPGRGEHSPVGWDGGRKAAPGSWTSGRSPRASRAPTVLTQLLGEDLLEGHLAPVLQVLLHDAADAERHRGRGDLEPPRLLSGLLALLPWKVAASSPRIQSGGHCWWVSSLWVTKIWPIPTMGYYLARKWSEVLVYACVTVWINLRGFCYVNGQSQKATCYVIPFIPPIQNRPVYRQKAG